MVHNGYMKAFKRCLLLFGLLPIGSYGISFDTLSSLPEKAKEAMAIYSRYRAGTASEEEIYQVERAKKIIAGAVVTMAIVAGVSYVLWRKKVSLVSDNDWSQIFEGIEHKIKVHKAMPQAPGCCGPSALINIARMMNNEPVRQPYGTKIDDIYRLSDDTRKGRWWLAQDELCKVMKNDEQFRKLDIGIFTGWDQDFLLAKQAQEIAGDSPELLDELNLNTQAIGNRVIEKLSHENKPIGIMTRIRGNHWIAVVIKKDDQGEINYDIADSMNSVKVDRLPFEVQEIIKFVNIAKDEHGRS